MKAIVKTRAKEWTIHFYTSTFKKHTYKHITISDNVIGWKRKEYTTYPDTESINNLNIPKKVKEKAIEMLKTIKK